MFLKSRCLQTVQQEFVKARKGADTESKCVTERSPLLQLYKGGKQLGKNEGSWPKAALPKQFRVTGMSG